MRVTHKISTQILNMT